MPAASTAFRPGCANTRVSSAEPIAPPAKNRAEKIPLRRLRTLSPSTKMARWPGTRLAATPMSGMIDAGTGMPRATAGEPGTGIGSAKLAMPNNRAAAVAANMRLNFLVAGETTQLKG